jgi:hypothetical protein
MCLHMNRPAFLKFLCIPFCKTPLNSAFLGICVWARYPTVTGSLVKINSGWIFFSESMAGTQKYPSPPKQDGGVPRIGMGRIISGDRKWKQNSCSRRDSDKLTELSKVTSYKFHKHKIIFTNCVMGYFAQSCKVLIFSFLLGHSCYTLISPIFDPYWACFRSRESLVAIVNRNCISHFLLCWNPYCYLECSNSMWMLQTGIVPHC